MINTAKFFAYAQERYRVHLRREAGQPRPWTEDKILQSFRFCNVFREDDVTTRWIREHITHSKYGNNLLGAMLIARWFNRVETLERMLPNPDHGTRDYSLKADLFDYWATSYHGVNNWGHYMQFRLSEVSPLVTGAYIVKTPNGMNKLQGLIWCLQQSLPATGYLQRRATDHNTLQYLWESLITYPFLGPFMSYEVVTDMRHTPVLDTATDIMTWASPGPGAARGFGRVNIGEPRQFNYNSAFDRRQIIAGMQDLLGDSQDPHLWPKDWPKWEMREVEHTLCEFDKYERARLGEGKPKQRYQGGAET